MVSKTVCLKMTGATGKRKENRLNVIENAELSLEVL